MSKEISEALKLVADSLVAASVVDTRWIDPDTNTLFVVIGGERYALKLEKV